MCTDYKLEARQKKSRRFFPTLANIKYDTSFYSQLGPCRIVTLDLLFKIISETLDLDPKILTIKADRSVKKLRLNTRKRFTW